MDSYEHKHEGIMDLGWEGLGDSLKLLVAKVAEDYQPEVVVGIAKGGVIPAVFISSALFVDFFPIKLSRRRNEQKVRVLPAWFVRPTGDLKNLRVLLVDDITVSGVELNMAKQAVLGKGAKEVRTATLAVHSESVKPDYFAIQTDDLILFPWDKQVFKKPEWRMNPEYAEEIENIEKHGRKNKGNTIKILNKKQRPTIETKRLMLRLFTLDDVREFQRLIGDRAIADTLSTIPYPFEDGMAEKWINRWQETFERGISVHFAITHKEQGFLMGDIHLSIDRENERAGIGYWIGKPYWNNGYCTEAAQAVLKYGFEVLKLNRIEASHMTRNPASGRVMQKNGMIHEGTLRQAEKRWGKLEDMEAYRILKSEYERI